MKLAAQFLGVTARRLLIPGAQFELQSVFESGVNMTTRGELVLLSSKEERAPWTVNVRGLAPRAKQLSGAWVTDTGSLQFRDADLVIDPGSAQLWIGEHCVKPANVIATRTALGRTQLSLFPPGLTGCGVGEQDLGELARALDAGDERKAAKTAQKLVGLGLGSTPAGDDFLLGLIGTLVLTGRQPIPLEIDGQTTLLATTQLKHAQRGELPESLDAVIRSLARTEPDLLESVERVLALGHTSGQDILAGVRFGFERALQT